MFNTYHAGNNIQTTQINAVTGAILKNHPKSWFERFHLKSDRANTLLQEGGYKFENSNKWAEQKKSAQHGGITVLQMVICGDMEVMAELVYTKDYTERTYKGESDHA